MKNKLYINMPPTTSIVENFIHKHKHEHLLIAIVNLAEAEWIATITTGINPQYTSTFINAKIQSLCSADTVVLHFSDDELIWSDKFFYQSYYKYEHLPIYSLAEIVHMAIAEWETLYIPILPNTPVENLQCLNNSDTTILFSNCDDFLHFCFYCYKVWDCDCDDDVMIGVWQDRKGENLAVRIVDEDFEVVSVEDNMVAVYWKMPSMEDAPPFIDNQYDCAVLIPYIN